MAKLYIVATPIGNLEDLSARAKRVLAQVDLVLCEDTRVTRKLLSAFGIKTPTESFHRHTKPHKREKLVERLSGGGAFALVSDAGTPGVSDPGARFVESAARAGVDVVPVPGPNAAVAALSVSGFPADRFAFIGFPPHKKGRNMFFEEIVLERGTVVLYESKHRIEKTLAQLPQNRKALVARELTKMHETLYRGTVADIRKQLEKSSTKGEFVIVLAPTS